MVVVLLNVIVNWCVLDVVDGFVIVMLLIVLVLVLLVLVSGIGWLLSIGIDRNMFVLLLFCVIECVLVICILCELVLLL